MSRTFLQKDFGTVRGVSMAAAGCGPTAVADIAYNFHRNLTPADVARWLYDRADFGPNGTTRTGITDALGHYGLQSLYATPEHTGNAEWDFFISLFEKFRDFACWGIVLAVGRKNGGRDDFWTSGGHYLAITDYDPNTKRIYVRDPAGRHTGYFSPSQLKYDCNAMWFICKQYL